MLRIPIEATSLWPAVPSRPASKLTLHAIQELVRLADRDKPANSGAPDHNGHRAVLAPCSSPLPERR
jgi:hypothetical protein